MDRAEIERINARVTRGGWRRRAHVPMYLALAVLTGPAGDIVHGRTASALLAVTGLLAFLAVFAAIIEVTSRPGLSGPHRPATPRVQRWLWLLLAALVALEITTALGFGRSVLMQMIFVVVATVFVVPGRWGIPAIGAATALMIGTLLVIDGPANPSAIASWALSVSMSGSMALLMRRRGLLIHQLRDAQGEIARLAAADAVVEERLRFARDLHDLLGHSLSVIVLKAELSRRLLDHGSPDRALAEVTDLEQIARRALEEVREAVTGYRARSLADELDRARTALEAAGVAVHSTVTAAALPPDIDDLLAWIVRESATNIVRHSRARRAAIELTAGDDAIRLVIHNDGVAAERTASDEPAGSGLVGLRERVAEAGGRLTAVAQADGFRVTAIVPLGAAPALAGSTAEPAAAEAAP